MSINGQPVNVLDSSGNFFSQIPILDGLNPFVIVATDAFGQTATTTLNISGVQGAAARADLNSLSDSSSFEPEYRRTSFNEQTNILYADVLIRNAGLYLMRAPLLIGVRNISDPSVRVREASGVTPDGIPYYDFSSLVGDGVLSPSESSGVGTLAFFNPGRTQFTYDLVLLGKLNGAPAFTSLPAVQASIGKTYRYEADAIDPDDDALTYSLLSNPVGMTIDPATGQITWATTGQDAGNHAVNVRVEDGRGGSSTQTYTLSVGDAPPNRPPVFTTVPVVTATIGAVDQSAVPLDLRTWTVVQLPTADQPNANWNVSADGSEVRQLVNSAASIFVSPDTGTDTRIEGRFKVDTTTDDDWMGFVFGYQDPQHFYVLDWAQGNENNFPGMRLRAIESPDPVDAAIMHGEPFSPARAQRLLYKNDIPWEEGVEYAFILERHPGQYTITIKQGTTALDSFTVFDTAFSSGRFGFYNYSQEQVIYSGFTRQTIPELTYHYDSNADDADGDPVTYSLVSGPAGMAVNSTTGEVLWGPTADQLGQHDVTVRASDGRGGVATQSYVINVQPDPGNHAPVIISEPVTTALIPSASAPVPLSLNNWDVVQLGTVGDQAGPGSWQVSADGKTATQTINSEASALIGPDDISTARMDGVLHVGSVGDDDFIGLVFGYQDAQHFYLFNWSQGGENVSTRMQLRRIESTTPINGNILVGPDTAASRILAQRTDIGWKDLTDYAFSLTHRDGIIRITIREADTAIATLIAQDETYEHGRFGLYAFSQESATFRNITRSDQTQAVYQYDVDAIDPDDDTLTYSLTQAPQGTEIDAVNGLVTWQPPSGLAELELVAHHWQGTGANGHYYTLSREVGTWTEANALAESLGGHLVSINNAAEQTFLEQTILATGNEAFWIGLTDRQTEGQFRWTSGEPVTYTNWGGGEPNDAHGGIAAQTGEDYTAINWQYANALVQFGKWNDTPDGGTTHNNTAFQPYRAIMEFDHDPFSVPVTVNVSDGRGGFDEQSFVISISPRADLSVDRVDSESLVYDGQTLSVAGPVSARVTNTAGVAIDHDFKVLFFEDKDHNGVFDKGSDGVLGDAIVTNPLPAGGSVTVSAQLSGHVLFTKNLVWAFVDSDQSIAESDESNNLANSGQDCVVAPAVGVFDPVIEWKKDTFGVAPNSANVMMTPAVVDLNADGISDIVFITFASARGGSSGGRGIGNVLRAISGADGAELWSVTDPNLAVESYAGIAVGDIDGDGRPEIIAEAQPVDPSFVTSDRLIAFEHDGTYKWTSPVIPGGVRWGSASIADLDHSGAPEIIIGGTVLNSDGTIRWDAATVGGIGRGDNVGIGPLSAVADLDLDGNPEIVAGRSAYRSNGQLYWNSAIPDGFPALGNFDLDANPEIVVVASGSVYLLGHDGTKVWGPIAIPGGGSGGAPTIADFDGDGQAEIGVAGASRYAVFEGNGSIKWQSPTQDQSSNVTGSSVFDFEGDGTAEVVYGDEVALRVYRGTDGAVLYELAKGSGTTYEYPLIVDVDGDGNAEIVATANNYAFGSKTGIYVIGSASDSWVNARAIWNQHTYHITNVNDDGTIPSQEINSWQAHNSYRLNALTSVGTTPLSAPNLTTSYAHISRSGGVRVSARIGNGGAIFVAAAVNVAFYDGDPRNGGTLLGTTSTSKRLNPGEFEDVKLSLPSGTTISDLWIRADDDGTNKGMVRECHENDNLYHPALGGSGEIRGTVSDSATNATQNLVQNGSLEDLGANFANAAANYMTLSATAHSAAIAGWTVSGDTVGGVAWAKSPTGDGRSAAAGTFFVDLTGISANAPNGALEQRLEHLIIGEQYTFSMDTERNGALPLVTIGAVPVSVSAGTPFTVGVDTWIPQTGTFTATSPSVVLKIANQQQGQTVNFIDNIRVVGLAAVGLSDWTLYLDQNQNSRFDVGELSTITDANGNYAFTDLPAGTHYVAEVQQGGWIQTAPADGVHVVALADGQVVTGRDFANRQGSGDNRNPSFNSTPPTGAVVGQRYSYRPVASDPDGDPLAFDLPSKPVGMAIDPSTGQIVWLPSADQTEIHDIVLRVQDGRGGVALQSFSITVSATNSPPIITSTPPTQAVVGLPYQYDVNALDPDGDTITFTLQTAPAGMTINASSGLLSFTPTAGQVGNRNVVVVASDGRGGQTTQSFTLAVVASATNRPPTIASQPPTNVQLGRTYAYQLQAADPDGDPLAINVVSAPSGMSIDASGLILWTPVAADVGQANSVQISVSDGRGGTATQNWSIDVSTQATNRPPAILSQPLFSATVGQSYRYNLVGSDPDNDSLAWSLLAGPHGMILDSATGVLVWTPQSNQLGPQQVSVLVSDLRGGTATQSWTITVRSVNVPPNITTNPPTSAAVGALYTYAVGATDANGDPLTFSLTAAPASMTISAQGLIRWTPQANQTGSQTVTIQVEDGRGGFAAQQYGIIVASAVPNRYPTITSTPSFFARVAAAYQYQMAGSDPDGDTLRFALLSGPAGMSVDPQSGLLQWTPTAGQVGLNDVRVAAFDPAGAGMLQSYRINATVNQAPTITSIAPADATPGEAYRYDILADDPDGDVLTYQLNSAPSGMTIDQLGRIRWTPGAVDVGTNHQIQITVTDSYGDSDAQSYVLAVAADTTAPRVQIQTSAAGNSAALGSNLTIIVSASDNIGVTSLSLAANGVPLSLDASGRTTLALNQAGQLQLGATAGDAAGNLGTASAAINVIDPTDTEAPSVDISSPASDDVITAPVDVIGSVTDNIAAGLTYTLLVAPVDSDTFTEFAQGTGPMTDDVLGRFDPSMLPNGSYRLRLQAVDSGGHTSTDTIQVSVAGDLKLGNFRLSFNDLTIPVSGIPITVTRTYDSLNAKDDGELGFGWRLEFRDTDLKDNVAKTGFEDYDIYNPFQAGTRVYLTLPGGRREGFTFKPRDIGGFFSERFYAPAFDADPGVTDRLSLVTPQNFFLIKSGLGFYDLGGALPYNPANPAFGTKYILTTKDGTTYQIDPNSGQLETISDTRDNTLFFSHSGITSSAGPRVTFTRDAQGRIVGLTDPAGNEVQYAYDARGDLASVTDRTDNQTRFIYRGTPAHYLQEVIDPLGRSGVRAEYDADGRLSRIINVDGKSVDLNYDPEHSIQTVVDPRGNPTTYEYDDRGNIVLEVDARGGETLRTYDADNNLLSQTDPLGNTTAFTYDSTGNVLTETDALGHVTRYTYNSLGQALTITDSMGNMTTNSYDPAGNLITTRDPGGAVQAFTYDSAGNPTSIADAAGNLTRFTFSSSGNILSQTDAAGNVSTYTYDANGNRLTETRTLTTPTGVRTLVTRYAYDAQGRQISVTDAEGGITRTEYDALGNVSATIDPLGHRTEYDYNDRNLLSETVLADGTQIQTFYDDAGNRIRSVDQLGRETHFVYDQLNRLTQTIYPDATPLDLSNNPRRVSEYDPAGQVIAEIDERGNRTEYEYDAVGSQILIRDALGNLTESSYDIVGRLVSQTDPLGHVTQFTYDSLGRRVSTRFADGTSIFTTYDSLGRSIAETDQLGRVTQFGYDALGRLTSVTDALNQLTHYAYDEAGNLITQTDANSHTTRYEYDGLGRRLATVLPLGQRSTSVYDAGGNLVRTTDFNSDTITYDYDVMHRLTARHFPDGSGVGFTYSLVGQRATETDARGTTTYTYDERDRLIQRVEPDGTTIRHTWDAAGNRTATITPFQSINYTFDQLNRMKTVSEASTGLTTYTYDAASRLIRTSLPNGTSETRQYDSVNHLTFLRNAAPDNSVISSYAYTLDAAGNRTRVVEDTGRRVDYSYDALYRLTQEQITDTVNGNRTMGYVYDPVGNRLTRTDTVGGTTAYTYGANDRMLTETTGGVGTTYGYDNNGNTISKFTSATDRTIYDYDFQNRLVRADVTTVDGTTVVEYVHNADGLRVARIEDGAEVRHLVDTTHPYAEVVEEYTPGVAIAHYVHGLDLISQSRSGAQSIYLVDGLGSTRALANAVGAVTDSYTYDAFGIGIFRIGSTANAYLYAGESRDSSIGLDYLRARLYRPGAGRFTTADSFPGSHLLPVTLHRYIYANANPIMFSDPSGQFSLMDVSIANAIRNTLADIQITVGFGLIDIAQGKSFEEAIFVPMAFAATFPLLRFFTRALGPSARIIVQRGGWLWNHEGLGHTITEHVGKRAPELSARFLNPIFKGDKNSAFFDLRTAESVIERTLKDNSDEISQWLQSTQPRLPLYYSGSEAIGIGVIRGQSVEYQLSGARVILKRDAGGKGFFILTAFPE